MSLEKTYLHMPENNLFVQELFKVHTPRQYNIGRRTYFCHLKYILKLFVSLMRMYVRVHEWYKTMYV